MPETIKNEKLADWISRILMTLDILVVLSGYFSWFQTKKQLVTPLIPRSTIYEIFSDSGDIYFKDSIIASLIFLAGLWFYSFKRKTIAIIFFAAVILFFLTKNFLFRM